MKKNTQLTEELNGASQRINERLRSYWNYAAHVRIHLRKK
jgi:hypothetical protein